MTIVSVFFYREQSDAHAQLQYWRSENPDGFLLNCLTRTSGKLHRAECHHLGDSTWESDGTGGDLVRKRKACALNIGALRAWAVDHGVTVDICSDCRPAQGEDLVAAEAKAADAAGEFEPDGVQDARTKTIGAIVRRQGQPAFRRKLIEAYDGRCAVTGCALLEVLDAAHIIAYQGPGTNHPQNGLLLRTDIHTLLDLGLLAIDTESMTVITADALAGSDYASLAGTPLRLPRDRALSPCKTALDRQREKAGLNRH
ncbi:HNH endonuclease [Sorangium sp. So ce834]|uniref:HNH endonuclease n=1 Tax=Sorangium sp. So ce834 TaxID=3133321 RepID=UPI003F62937D